MNTNMNLEKIECSIWRTLWQCMVYITSDTLEQFIDTVHRMQNHTTCNEKLFAGQIHQWSHWYLHRDGIGCYTTNSLLF